MVAVAHVSRPRLEPGLAPTPSPVAGVLSSLFGRWAGWSPRLFPVGGRGLVRRVRGGLRVRILYRRAEAREVGHAAVRRAPTPRRPLAWALASAALAGALLLGACRARSGSTCISEGEASCDGSDRMLVCVDGTWSAVACAGPKGCAATGRFIDCDDSLARAGDPCGADGAESAACSTDGKTLMRCDGKTWTAHRPCRGPKSCASPSQRYVDCDDSLAQLGDDCDDGQRSCSLDGTQLLVCNGGRMAVEASCSPRRCRADDDFADCEPGAAVPP